MKKIVFSRSSYRLVLCISITIFGSACLLSMFGTENKSVPESFRGLAYSSFWFTIVAFFVAVFSLFYSYYYAKFHKSSKFAKGRACFMFFTIIGLSFLTVSNSLFTSGNWAEFARSEKIKSSLEPNVNRILNNVSYLEAQGKNEILKNMIATESKGIFGESYVLKSFTEIDESSIYKAQLKYDKGRYQWDDSQIVSKLSETAGRFRTLITVKVKAKKVNQIEECITLNEYSHERLIEASTFCNSNESYMNGEYLYISKLSRYGTVTSIEITGTEGVDLEQISIDIIYTKRANTYSLVVSSPIDNRYRWVANTFSTDDVSQRLPFRLETYFGERITSSTGIFPSEMNIMNDIKTSNN